MNAQDVQITLDFSKDVEHLTTLQVHYQQGPAESRTALGNCITAVAQVIAEKAKKQRQLLENAMVPGALSPEKLSQAKHDPAAAKDFMKAVQS